MDVVAVVINQTLTNGMSDSSEAGMTPGITQPKNLRHGSLNSGSGLIDDGS